MTRVSNLVSAALTVAVVAACKGEESTPATSTQAALPPDLTDMTPAVVFETNKGTIVLELDRAAAPKTVASFLLHVDAKFYDGLAFHRVIPGFMIQGGGFSPDMTQRASSAPALTNEADNGLQNVRGSVAMARTSDPHSAQAQFFINLVDNPNLDHTTPTPQGWGYAVFGHVSEGLDIVDEIARVTTRAVGQHEAVPVEPVIIERAYARDE